MVSLGQQNPCELLELVQLCTDKVIETACTDDIGAPNKRCLVEALLARVNKTFYAAHITRVKRKDGAPFRQCLVEAFLNYRVREAEKAHAKVCKEGGGCSPWPQKEKVMAENDKIRRKFLKKGTRWYNAQYLLPTMYREMAGPCSVCHMLESYSPHSKFRIRIHEHCMLGNIDLPKPVEAISTSTILEKCKISNENQLCRLGLRIGFCWSTIRCVIRGPRRIVGSIANVLMRVTFEPAIGAHPYIPDVMYSDFKPVFLKRNEKNLMMLERLFHLCKIETDGVTPHWREPLN